MTPAELNLNHAQPGLKFVEGPGGLVFAEVDNAGGEARICLQGAHLVSWRPQDQIEPVIWVSDVAKYAPGKSIRGGVPICWPWFGPHASEAGFPGHGFARTVPWQVSATATETNGATRINLVLVETEQTRAQWPHACRAELELIVGRQLTVSLTTHNLGDQAFTLGEALHTYFRIGDIGTVRVEGLDSVEYVDKVAGAQRFRQQGPVRFSTEVDRVYVGTETTCVIADPDLQRRIHIETRGSRSTVVWTPWQEKAEKMGDFGPGKTAQGGWREMLCVESGNALDNVVQVPAGGSHRLEVTYRATPLD